MNVIMPTPNQSGLPCTQEITLDAFQKKALEHIEADNTSVIVAAPTGSGKTLIAEYVIDQCLHQQKSCIYTAPIKALSNQKFRDFRRIHGDAVGLVTGDVSINASAPILIMTTEIYRNILLEDHSRIENVKWIIFDEIHYLDDFERGTVWEEALMLTPAHIKILALSATIPNLEKIASWFREVHTRPIVTVKEFLRPVPLSYRFQYNNTVYQTVKSLQQDCGKRHSPSSPIKNNRLLPLLKHLQDDSLLPAIYFSFSRRKCEYLAREVQFMNFLSAEAAQEASRMFSSLVEKFGLQQDWATTTLLPLVKRGIAFHHAGLLPSLKEIIERMFTLRLIQLIFTTETFALGINMPAKSVVFDAVSKFYGGYERLLKVRDFQQMAGRAGRRNIDPEGYVFLRIPPYLRNTGDIEHLLYGNIEEVTSQFNNSYATTLNLYQLFKETIYQFYELSFHYYQSAQKLSEDARHLIRKKVTLLKNLGYIQDERLTTKGGFASKIYGYELILSELSESGFLETLPPEELCIVVSAVIYEPRRGERKPALTKKTKRIRNVLMQALELIHRQERALKIFPRTKPPFFHNAEILQRWYSGQDFWQVARASETDEGELVRHFRMCIQILRELQGLPLGPDFKRSAQDALSAINRDVIDAEQQMTEEI